MTSLPYPVKRPEGAIVRWIRRIGKRSVIGSVAVVIGVGAVAAAKDRSPIVAPPVGNGAANIWIQSGGGACAGGRSASPITLAAASSPDRICGTWDTAWDAMNSGDTARVVEGTYPSQSLTGDKTSETFIIGNGDGDDVLLGNTVASDSQSCPDPFSEGSSWSVLCLDPNFVTVQNVTTLVNDPGPHGGLQVTGDNVTVRNFHTKGAANGGTLWASSIGLQGTNFLFDGGSVGRTDTVETANCQHAAIEPIWIKSSADTNELRNVSIGRYATLVGAGPRCGVDNVPHLESVRFEDSDNITFRGVTFNGPSDTGSGHIFTSSDPDNIVFINTVFESRYGTGVNASFTVAGGQDWKWFYNTFLDEGGFNGAPGGTNVFVGNFGRSPGCGTTNTKNVWTGSGSCGTDTYFGAASFGVDSNNKLQAGSPAIDAAETPSASDSCTDPASVNSVDAEGTVRPQGSICDAGADER